MDPITHGLLGAHVGRSVTALKKGKKREQLSKLRITALFGALGAMAPDLDFFIHSAQDPTLALRVHRGMTHALVMSPFVALFVAVLAFIFLPKQRRNICLIYFASLAGAFTHGLLDACTAYGTQLLWPFSRTHARIAWNIIAELDVTFTLILLIGLFVGKRKKPSTYRLSSWGVLLICAAYLGWGSYLHHRATVFEKQLAQQQGYTIDTMSLHPIIGLPFFNASHLWQAVILDTQGTLHIGPLFIPSFKSIVALEPMVTQKAAPQDIVRSSPRFVQENPLLSRALRTYAWFSKGFLSTHLTTEGTLAAKQYLIVVSYHPLISLWGLRFTPQGIIEDNHTPPLSGAIHELKARANSLQKLTERP